MVLLCPGWLSLPFDSHISDSCKKLISLGTDNARGDIAAGLDDLVIDEVVLDRALAGVGLGDAPSTNMPLDEALELVCRVAHNVPALGGEDIG